MGNFNYTKKKIINDHLHQRIQESFIIFNDLLILIEKFLCFELAERFELRIFTHLKFQLLQRANLIESSSIIQVYSITRKKKIVCKNKNKIRRQRCGSGEDGERDVYIRYFK